MALTKITKTGITADAIDATKIADDAIETAQIKADAVDATKIADNSISEEHLDTTAILGNTELSEAANSGDILLIYDTSAGVLKKILASNIGSQVVTLASVSPTNAISGDGTGNHTFTITGTNFTGGSAELVNTSGAILNFDSVTVNSATQITGVIAKSSLLDSGEPYDIRVLGSNGAQATKRDQINVDASPIFVTDSGSLGTVLAGVAGSVAVNATDPDSAGNVTFELQSGSLPPGYTLTNTAAEGGTAIIAGTDSTTSSSTTFNFVLRAVDAASNTSSRAYSFTSRVITTTSFTSSGTFSVPAGTTVADVLVVGGGGGGGAPSPNPGAIMFAGGGGAGGLVFFPAYPVTGGTITVTVGNGGPRANANTGQPGSDGQNSVFGSPGDPGLGQGGVLTSVGGGGGGGSNGPSDQPGRSGGSGGGGGGRCGSPTGGSAGAANQPTQSGNSGAYGFGSAGGTAKQCGGGGGGAAQGTGNDGTGTYASQGGSGKAYTIADGTTSVTYAGGGGGAYKTGAPSPANIAQGGTGGGGHGATQSVCREGGQANKGGGAGGGGEFGTGGDGGKGVVIVRY